LIYSRSKPWVGPKRFKSLGLPKNFAHFQTDGPAKENARSANLVRVRGLMNVTLTCCRRSVGWSGCTCTLHSV